MVISQIVWSDKFRKEVTKIKDNKLKEKLQKQIENIIDSPELGKPLRYDLQVKPFCRIYSKINNTN